MSWPLRMLVNIYFVSIPLYIYISWRGITALSTVLKISSNKALIAAGLVFLLISALPCFVLLNKSTPEYFSNSHLVWQDYVLTFPFWVVFVILISVLPYFLSLDIFQLGFRFFGKRYDNLFGTFRLIVLALFIVYVPVRIYFDTYTISVRDFVIHSPEVEEDINLTLFADLQVDRFTQSKKINQLTGIVKQSNTDLILFGGDMVTRGNGYISQALEVMEKTNPGSPRVACMGDHDFWADPIRIAQGMRQADWIFLENEHHVMQIKGKRVLITGITYIYSQRPGKNLLLRVFESAPEADVKIVLVHQPAERVMEIANQFGYDLMVCGHTHGGQMLFNPFGISVTPSQFENRIVSGMGSKGNLPVIVTNGIGLTLAPIRFQAPAEIVNIRIAAGH